ncbi:MAG TPA: hypothetical protein VN622_05560 [Clostridia bacterium]|nr:hypothetical protein [Clostridia bacterium]
MPGLRYARLIEKYSDALAIGIVHKLHAAERTDSLRAIPATELEHDVRQLVQHLGDWLDTKTESDVHQRFTRLGARRGQQGVPLEQLVWAMIISKEHLWTFMQGEALADDALELLSELEFVISLEQFFDRAVYYVIVGHKSAMKERQAA